MSLIFLYLIFLLFIFTTTTTFTSSTTTGGSLSPPDPFISQPPENIFPVTPIVKNHYEEKKSSLSVGAIIGITLGSLLFLSIVVYLLFRLTTSPPAASQQVVVGVPVPPVPLNQWAASVNNNSSTIRGGGQ
jgi:energy-coupling factor transporter transmembrane protein EcfT